MSEHKFEDICVIGVENGCGLGKPTVQVNVDPSLDPDTEGLKYILLSKEDIAYIAFHLDLLVFPKQSQINGGVE